MSLSARKTHSQGLIASSALFLACTLAACGGGSSGTGGAASTATGGSDSSSGDTSSTVPTGSTQTTATYASDSAQAAVFERINSYRQQCGFPQLRQNTVLDLAAQHHADYMVANGGLVTDTEAPGNPEFTGVSGQDRAGASGWPMGIWVGASDAGEWTESPLSQGAYGQALVNGWSVGVYHQATIASQASLIGIGVAQSSTPSLVGVVGGVEIANSGATTGDITTPSDSPLTFPCQGVTGVPFKGVSEQPTPPNVSAQGWGTPVTVIGNPNDVVLLTSGSMIAAGDSTVITLNILTSANDTTTFIAKSQSVGYPASPLEPNTTYSVTLTGTVNGNPFTRAFTFTTGANAG